jgi:hypothetical protein
MRCISARMAGRLLLELRLRVGAPGRLVHELGDVDVRELRRLGAERGRRGGENDGGSRQADGENASKDSYRWEWPAGWPLRRAGRA